MKKIIIFILNIKENELKYYSLKLKLYNINLLLRKNKGEYILSLFINR